MSRRKPTRLLFPPPKRKPRPRVPPRSVELLSSSKVLRPRVKREPPPPTNTPTLLVTGVRARRSRAFATNRLVLVSLTVSPPTLAGAYPPVTSNPRCPVPQKVSRAPPITLTSRLKSLVSVEKELLVGMYTPAHGTSSTPP